MVHLNRQDLAQLVESLLLKASPDCSSQDYCSSLDQKNGFRFLNLHTRIIPNPSMWFRDFHEFVILISSHLLINTRHQLVSISDHCARSRGNILWFSLHCTDVSWWIVSTPAPVLLPPTAQAGLARVSGSKSVKNAEIWNYLPDLGEDINFNQLQLIFIIDFFTKPLSRLDLSQLQRGPNTN